jgi:hypothetical protein
VRKANVPPQKGLVPAQRVYQVDSQGAQCRYSGGQ